MPDPHAYWLLKTEPATFAWADLMAAPDRMTTWDGVRNFQARNLLRHQIQEGDEAFFYHSGEQRAIVGIVRVVRSGFPDPSAFDPASPYFDPRSHPDNPVWYTVNVQALQVLPHPQTLAFLRTVPELVEMALLRRARLSVQPVTGREWRIICTLSGL